MLGENHDIYISKIRMKKINSYELAKRICDCLSDGYDDEEYRDETETTLYNELSQIPDDSFIKAALLRLCERVEEMEKKLIMVKYLVDYYETYSKSYEIEANSKEEAEEKVRYGIQEGELDPPENCTDSWCETEEMESE